MNFSQKSFKPKPPDKGSFPLDHEGRPTITKLLHELSTRNAE